MESVVRFKNVQGVELCGTLREAGGKVWLLFFDRLYQTV